MPRICLFLLLAISLCSCTLSRGHETRLVGYWHESAGAPWVYFFRSDGTGAQVKREDIDPGKEKVRFNWWTEGEHLFIEPIDEDGGAERAGFFSFGRSGSLRVGPYALGKDDVVLRKIDPNDPKSRRTTRRSTDGEPR